MSLDVYLTIKGQGKKRSSSGIFVRRNGANTEISREEWDKLHPGKEPTTFIGADYGDEIYSANITHNLGEMAAKAGIYEALWRPEEKGWFRAKDIIRTLEVGLQWLKTEPQYFEQFNAENGWGLYENFVPFVENYLEACKQYPNAKITVSR